MKNLSRRKFIHFSTATTALLLLPNIHTAAMNTITSMSSDILTRPIPKCPQERIPIVGMGTWQTFDVGNNATERTNLKKVLSAFIEMGGTLLDSSPMYGSSEEVLGDLAVELDVLKQLFMATKVWTTGKNAGIDQMKASMQKMQCNPMDLMQVHNLLDFKTHIKTLQRWKAEGKIRYIGITHYTDSYHDDLVRLIESESLDFVQFNYSILSRHAEKQLLPAAQANGVATLINRPYESGSLFRQVKGKQLPEWVKEYGINSWGQFFLKFILSHPAVTCVIPATSKEHHLRDNMGAGFGEMPDDKVREEMSKVLI
ncbi:MAG: aldo/keto reductase [Chitinophagales bacterium]